MSKKENPCKGKKKGTKALLTCQYKNKQISQKKYIRKMNLYSFQKTRKNHLIIGNHIIFYYQKVNK